MQMRVSQPIRAVNPCHDIVCFSPWGGMNFVCCTPPEEAEGPWRAPNMTWSHSCCLSHTSPGVHHSIAVGFQLKTETVDLLWSKMAFMQCGKSEPRKR